MAFFGEENFWLYVPLVLWITGILYLSSSKGSVSSTLTYIVPMLKCLFPGHDGPAIRTCHIVFRKLCHFVGYGVLALLASIVFYNSSLPVMARFWFVAAFITVLLVALVDELRQSYYPERNASSADVLLDCFGGLTVILVFWLFSNMG